jgi:hypothetical protein
MPLATRNEAQSIAENCLKAHPRPNCDGIEKGYGFSLVLADGGPERP